jgi:L-fuculose-phosphate aldolase
MTLSQIKNIENLSKAEKKLAINLAYSSRILSNFGHDDFNQGQVSARIPGSDKFLIKRALSGFSEANPEDMIEAHIKNNMPPSKDAPPELPLHLAIYESRSDVNAIIHSHAPYSLIFGATDLELRPISHDAACFIGKTSRFLGTSNTVLDIQTGREISSDLGQNNIIFLRNHGGVIVSKSLKEATVYSLLLERACKLQIIAESLCSKYSSSSFDDIEKKQSYIYSDMSINSYWDYSVRELKRKNVNFDGNDT